MYNSIWGSFASSVWSATLLVFKVWSIPCIRSYIILILILILIIMIRPGTSLGWSFSSCSSPFSSSPASFSTLSRTDLVLRDGERTDEKIHIFRWILEKWKYSMLMFRDFMACTWWALMTLTSVGSHLQPEVFRQIFQDFHIFRGPSADKCTHIQFLIIFAHYRSDQIVQKAQLVLACRRWWDNFFAGSAPSVVFSYSTSLPTSSSAGGGSVRTQTWYLSKKNYATAIFKARKLRQKHVSCNIC